MSRLQASIRARIGSFLLDVDLDVSAEGLTLIGPNGAGKTTMLASMLGLHPVEHARVCVAGVLLADTEQRISVPVEDRRLGYVPQEGALFPHLTVLGNIAFAVNASSRHLGREAKRKKAHSLLEAFGLDRLAERRPASLSGGEKQRVALARALAVEPRAILLDEPFSALDANARQQVRAELQVALREAKLPSVVVLHDPRDVRALGDRIAVLEAGRVTQVGSWRELSASPATPFVEAFVRSSERDDHAE